MKFDTIVALLISKRTQAATKVQEVLTRHGCIISVRLGLHEAGAVCSDQGLVLLGVNGTRAAVTALVRDLRKIDGVRVKTMDLTR